MWNCHSSLVLVAIDDMSEKDFAPAKYQVMNRSLGWGLTAIETRCQLTVLYVEECLDLENMKTNRRILVDEIKKMVSDLNYTLLWCNWKS